MAHRGSSCDRCPFSCFLFFYERSVSPPKRTSVRPRQAAGVPSPNHAASMALTARCSNGRRLRRPAPVARASDTSQWGWRKTVADSRLLSLSELCRRLAGLCLLLRGAGTLPAIPRLPSSTVPRCESVKRARVSPLGHTLCGSTAASATGDGGRAGAMARRPPWLVDCRRVLTARDPPSVPLAAGARRAGAGREATPATVLRRLAGGGGLAGPPAALPSATACLRGSAIPCPVISPRTVPSQLGVDEAD